MRLSFVILMVSWIFVIPAQAGKIKRAYAALDIYNYFEAKRLFEKAEKKYPTASCYGLSIIYQRTDNPFTNIDSAYNKIQKAIEHFPELKPKLREKYLLLSIDSITLIQQRNIISDIMFANTAQENTIESYDLFATKHPWSGWKGTAIYRRDSIAFETAITEGKAAGFEEFLKQYPNSSFSKEAKSSFDRLLYVEKTESDNFVDYLSFLEQYPNSPYRPDAEDKIYEISTRMGTADAYEQFIKDFPTNHNVKNAWKKLFNSTMQEEYSQNSLTEFKNSFPDYPYSGELEAELELVEVELLPAMYERKWGFFNRDKSIHIPFEYDEIEEFAEGLAVVQIEDKYGYINKSGEVVIQLKFDDALSFNEGHAVVEVSENWGIINRSGEYTVDPMFEDLGSLKEGLAYFMENDLYGYFDEKGSVRIKPQFADANDFEDGKAIVADEDDNYGVIDPFGTVLIPFKYEDLEVYGSDIYKAKMRSNWGIIDNRGDTIAPFIYDYIGEMNDDRAIVERGGEFNFIKPNGELILSKWVPTYSEFRQLALFRDGYAKIQFDDAFNLIDTTGKKLFPRNQLNVGQYGNLIAVKKGRHWGYLTKTGSTVIPNTFTMAKSFKGEYGIAGEEPLWGVINKKGKYTVEPYFENLSFMNDSILLAKSRGNYGLLTVQGDTLLGFSYLSIEPIDEEIVEVQQKRNLFYYNLRTGEFIRREE